MSSLQSSGIYVVDDSDLVRQSLLILLREMGRTEIGVFESGSAFLDIARDLPSGTILLDHNLNDMSSFDVLHRLPDDAGPFAAVMTSGSDADGLFLRALRAGSVDFIAKPFVLARLQEALARSRERLAGPQAQLTARRRLLALPAESLDVLTGMGMGLSGSEIAAEYGLTPVAVASLRAALMVHFGVAGFRDLMRLAFAGGLAGLMPPTRLQG